jgi:hypothetical protein
VPVVSETASVPGHGAAAAIADYDGAIAQLEALRDSPRHIADPARFIPSCAGNAIAVTFAAIV